MTFDIDNQWDADIANLVVREEAARRAEHNPSGKISAGMMGKPAQECVLRLLGVPAREVEPYVLRKFARGNQVEDWFVEKMVKCYGEERFQGQRETSYRDGIGFIDLAEASGDKIIPHEVKSVTNAKYKRITEGAWEKDSFGQRYKGEPGPDLGHAYQATFYGLAEGSPHFYIHYIASDDLRITTFKIPTVRFAAHVESHITTIQEAFLSGKLPDFQGFLGWHNMAEYSDYPRFIGLSGTEAEALLKELYPEAYSKLKEGV